MYAAVTSLITNSFRTWSSLSDPDCLPVELERCYFDPRFTFLSLLVATFTVLAPTLGNVFCGMDGIDLFYLKFRYVYNDMIVIHKYEYDNVIKTYDCKSYACEIFLSRNTMLIGQIKFHKTTDQYIVLI